MRANPLGTHGKTKGFQNARGPHGGTYEKRKETHGELIGKIIW